MTALSVDRRDDLPLILIAYVSFMILGFPGAMLGVLTPAIRQSFGLSLDTIGQYFLAYSVGYVISSAMSGRLTAHFRTGILLTMSCLLTAGALLGIATAPSWTAIVLFAGLLGAANAVQDAGMNIVFAARFNARLMNWLHASFGLGALLAPLLATWLLQAGIDWRFAYFGVVGLYLLVVLLFFLTIDRWTITRSREAAAAVRDSSLLRTLRLPFVWVGIGLFFIMAGLEAATGQWAPSLLSEGRGIDAVTAGYWTTAYWASFTIGRIFFGAVDFQLSAQALVRAMATLGIGGALLLWWSPADIFDLVALIIIGFALAPMFAVLVTHTQKTLGDRHGSNAIGIQMAAASLGVGTIPWVAGVAANAAGLDAIAIVVVALFVLLTLLVLFLGRVGRMFAASGGR